MFSKIANFIPDIESVDAGLSIIQRIIKGGQRIFATDYNKNDYYFEEVNKKVFIKKNGDGVIVCSCDLYVIRPNKVENFVRGIDISDAKQNTKFPTFKSMLRRKNKFFSEYGFWYESENNIITSVEECYDDPSLQISNMNNNKYLGIKFLIDKNRLEKKHKYRIVYGYSIPGLYPVKDGKHDRTEYNYNKYGAHSSSITVQHMSKNLRFAVYLENGFKLNMVPYGYAIKNSDNKENEPDVCEVRNNILYTKYLYTVKSPEKYRTIRIEWKLQ